MGSIARSAANLITTSGVVLKGAVNNDSFDNVTALPSSFGDGITLISSQTASNSASISFTSGLTSTYKAYKFVFSSIHVRNDVQSFQFNLSTDSGSNYNVTKTSTMFRAYHDEADTATAVEYQGSWDLAQSTSNATLSEDNGNGADESASGTLIIFNPSSTTYVKHWISDFNVYHNANYTVRNCGAGYGNTTSAINAVRFLAASGNFDGTIYLYGIK